MSKSGVASKDSVEKVAGTIVRAWRDGHAGDLRKQVTLAKSLVCSGASDTFEMEKMELLEGALESVQGARPEQAEAAINVLEHLAHGVTRKVRPIRRRP